MSERIERNGKSYLTWAHAGGPNECKHGYAAGIPCPDCDASKLPSESSPAGETASEPNRTEPWRDAMQKETHRCPNCGAECSCPRDENHCWHECDESPQATAPAAEETLSEKVDRALAFPMSEFDREYYSNLPAAVPEAKEK